MCLDLQICIFLQPQLSQMQPDSDYILDFTGNAEVSDAVLSSMANLPFMNRDSVIGIRLTGCHFVTDVGVALMADIFHNLKKVTVNCIESLYNGIVLHANNNNEIFIKSKPLTYK